MILERTIAPVFADAFAQDEALVCFAMKANSNQAVLATLADDPRTAACLLDAPSPRRWRRSSLATSLSRVAHILAEQARQHRATAGPAPHSVAIQQPSMVHRHGELEVC